MHIKQSVSAGKREGYLITFEFYPETEPLEKGVVDHRLAAIQAAARQIEEKSLVYFSVKCTARKAGLILGQVESHCHLKTSEWAFFKTPEANLLMSQAIEKADQSVNRFLSRVA